MAPPGAWQTARICSGTHPSHHAPRGCVPCCIFVQFATPRLRHTPTIFFRPQPVCASEHGVSPIGCTKGGGTPNMNTPPAGLGSEPMGMQQHSSSWCPRKLPEYAA